jgi:hypothetical protein
MRPTLLLTLAWAASLAVFLVLFERPGPLFVNVGAGDAPFARGFRERWERDGLTGSGETMFRWAVDGSRLELPVSVSGGHVSARVRLARFAAQPAEVSVEAAGHEVDRWMQPPLGWRVREIDLGDLRGPLALAFRRPAPVAGTPLAPGEPMAVAVDWVEIQGARTILPTAAFAGRLALFFLGAPLIVLLLTRSRSLSLGVGALAAAIAAFAAWRDRLGGAWACAEAAAPAVVAVLAIVLLHRLMVRGWPDAAAARTAALAVPVALVLAAAVAFFHPFYYYPDVDTHGRFLDALRTNPSLLVDPTQPWQRRGDVTREIGGQKVPIPYAMVFHAVAWPLSPMLGDTGALKTVAVISAGAVVLLAYPLARAAALPPAWAIVAQVLAAALPVLTSRLSLALYPTLFGQAWVTLLIVHLARRLSHLDGARDGAAATTFVFLAEAAYTGSLLMVSAVVLVVTAIQFAAGEWRRALRLSIGWAIATAILMATMYVGFLPTLWGGVLPYVFEGGGAAGALAADGAGINALRRLGLFYDAVFPVLAAVGLIAYRATPVHARRVLGGAVAAGAMILVLRYVLPTALRDAKEVELLLAPVAVLASAGLAVAWAQGRSGRALAVLALLAGLAWAILRDVSLYADRFVAVGR